VDNLSGSRWMALMTFSPDTGEKQRSDTEGWTQRNVDSGALAVLRRTFSTLSAKNRLISATSIAELAG